MSTLYSPENPLLAICPPKAPNPVVTFEKANQESHILFNLVLDPMVILMVNLVFCRLVGLTDT